jgi:hypothetical protein
MPCSLDDRLPCRSNTPPPPNDPLRLMEQLNNLTRLLNKLAAQTEWIQLSINLARWDHLNDPDVQEITRRYTQQNSDIRHYLTALALRISRFLSGIVDEAADLLPTPSMTSSD